MKPRAYIETMVVSYLTGRTGRNLIIAAHQELTREWWDEVLPVLGGCISDLVLEEASDGDATAAANGIEFFVTWNCKHLANAWIRTRLVSLIESLRYRGPVICTPEELMEAPQ